MKAANSGTDDVQFIGGAFTSLNNKIIGSQFINAQEILPNGQLIDIKIYKFDNSFHMVSFIQAEQASYQGNHSWFMTNVMETDFSNRTAVRGNNLIVNNKFFFKT